MHTYARQGTNDESTVLKREKQMRCSTYSICHAYRFFCTEECLLSLMMLQTVQLA